MAQCYVMVAGGGAPATADRSGELVDPMHTRRWFLALPPTRVLPGGDRTAASAVAPRPVRSSCGQALHHRRPRPASVGRESTHTPPGIPGDATVTGCDRRDSYARAAACLLASRQARAPPRAAATAGSMRSTPA